LRSRLRMSQPLAATTTASLVRHASHSLTWRMTAPGGYLTQQQQQQQQQVKHYSMLALCYMHMYGRTTVTRTSVTGARNGCSKVRTQHAPGSTHCTYGAVSATIATPHPVHRCSRRHTQSIDAQAAAPSALQFPYHRLPSSQLRSPAPLPPENTAAHSSHGPGIHAPI
jgi:hypothetical protein